MSFAMRPVLHALCLLQALALGACATQAPTSPAKQDGPARNQQVSSAAAAKAAAANKRAAARAAAAEKAAADKAAAAERAATARAAAQAKAEAARVAAAARAEAAKAAAVARAEAAARADAAAKAELARAAAAARAETVARAEAKARADAAARADASARAEAKARADALAKADAEARAEAAARANAVARADAAAVMVPASLGPARTTTDPAAADVRPDYAVGGGDVLRISVYQSPDLSLDARVSESGTISYPLLGQLSVGGLSIPQVEATIARRLREGRFIKRPQVAVMLMQVRANQVSVLGMANRPGRYPIEVNGMLLSELLALAGGVAPGGSEIVTLSGIRNGKQFQQRFDVNAVFASGAQNENPTLSSGDTLYIERLPNVYIYGEVQRPGPIPLTADMTLMQAVASGGGLTDRGTERGLRVHRRDPSGEVHVVQPRMDEVLQPGDVVYVRESLF